MQGGERATSTTEASSTLGHGESKLDQLPGLGLLPLRRSLQAQRGPGGEVRMAGRGPASVQTPRQQSQPEAPVSAWVKYLMLPQVRGAAMIPPGRACP